MTKKSISGGTGRKDERYINILVKTKLREAELNEKGEELGKLDLKINTEREEGRAEATARRETIKKLTIERDKLAEICSTGEEERMTKCIQKADFDRGRIVVINVKTNETVSERAMENDERDRMNQGQMPWMDQDDVDMPEKAKNDVESGPAKKSKGNGTEAPAEA